MVFEVRNATPAKTTALPIKGRNGEHQLAVIAKWTFAVDASGGCKIADDPAEIDLVDSYNGDEPAKASIRRPSQLFDWKPGTDVVLLGHARPREGDAPEYVDVTLAMGPLHKTVRAFGLRTWKVSSFGGVSPGPALPMREPVPLIYEMAWGGMDLRDERRPLGEPRNYVGRGISARTKELVDQPAALLEYADRPLGIGRDTPAAFNPIHRHWQPRASYAGTYDERWMDVRMPLLPEDFDPRFHVCVPDDQWSETPMRGDEPVRVEGVTPEGEWNFTLPRIAPGFSSVILGKRQEHRTHLDTIVIDADHRRVELTWRAAVPLPRKLEMIDRVMVFSKRVV